MKPFILLPVTTLADAARETAKPGSVLKAGGVDLLDRMKEGLDSPKTVVSLSRIAGHDRIEAGPPARIGALATLAKLAGDADLRRSFPALSEAAAGAATIQIRNMATLGGNLCQRPRCWYYRLEEFHCLKKGGTECFAREGENRFLAVFDTDLLCCCVHPSAAGTALMAYDATLEVISPRGQRTLPIEEFFHRPSRDATRENTLRPGEVIQSIGIPAQPAGSRSVYRKLKEKESFDWPIVEICVRLAIAGGAIRDARVVFGSVAPTPLRSRTAEAILNGASPSDDLVRQAAEAAVRDARPLSQTAYKARLARVELERALRQAFA